MDKDDKDAFSINTLDVHDINFGTETISITDIQPLDLSARTMSGLSGTTLTVGAQGSTNHTYSWNQGYSGPGLFTTNNTGASQFYVKGNAEFDGDLKVDGKSLKEFMNKMEQRLAILVPDPAKLEHFEALRKAYEHYKMLERLCELPKNDDET